MFQFPGVFNFIETPLPQQKVSFGCLMVHQTKPFAISRKNKDSSVVKLMLFLCQKWFCIGSNSDFVQFSVASITNKNGIVGKKVKVVIKILPLQQLYASVYSSINFCFRFFV
jgi:hypothetical protein